MSEDLIITCDICPHGSSSTLCEICCLRGKVNWLNHSLLQVKEELKTERLAVDYYSNKKDYEFWQPNGDKKTATHTSKIHHDKGFVARQAQSKREVIL